MNAPRTTEYDYIDFLIATPYSYSCVEAARVQPEAADKPAHDSITRLLHRLEPSVNELWRERKDKSRNRAGC